MKRKTHIIFRGQDHPVQVWARERNIAPGTIYPAPCPIADKPGGKKGKPIASDNQDIHRILMLNGNNYHVLHFILRIGGWLYNTASNKHLIPRLRGWMWWANNYVPYPLPKGKKAFREKIYCDGNEVTVDKVQGAWSHLAPGIGQLTQVGIGNGRRYNSYIRWPVPAGWIETKLLER
jgi:hypothetical protein